MKKQILSAILVINLVLILAGATSAVSQNPGAIWTTRSDCGDVSQNVNQYAIGEAVYVNGAGFDEGTYNWTVMGNPGGSSCDPSVVVASGSYAADGTGEFCFQAYTVQQDDCGEYKVNFGNKNDNFRIDLNLPVVPEFGVVVGMLTLVSAVGIFFFVRRK